MILTEGIVIGHHVSFLGIKVDPTKIKVIANLIVTTTQREVRSFLGHLGYYRHFIENFTKIALPLFKSLLKDVDFCWIDKCQKAFETLKQKLSSTLVLRGPNWTIPFHISTNAFDPTIRVVLGQKYNSLTYVIYFIRKILTLVGLSYIVIEKEFLALLHAINKFRHYITSYEVFMHIDHSTIRYLMNKSIINGKITRWLLHL